MNGLKKMTPNMNFPSLLYMFLNLDAIITIISYVLCAHDYTFITKITYSFCGEEKNGTYCKLNLLCLVC